MKKKLWESENTTLDPIIEAFETGDDLLLDQKLVIFDVQGSLAHAKMLSKIGILSAQELKLLEKGLKEILLLDAKGKFVLEKGDEDVHTKIENYLNSHFGEVGKKIHTGRSRNDQVLTVLRLFTKVEINKIQKEIITLISALKKFNKKYGKYSMPGYTHMQKAMPSNVGIWIESFIASFRDDVKNLDLVLEHIDQSPLGSAAGYGVSLPLDKKYTASLLGFSKVQENPIYAQGSKGKFEALVLGALVQILLTINKFSSDVLLFTTSEFGFFNVSDKITTGSSIMPQKKNIDVAELLRSKVHIVLGNYTTIVSISTNLISGYNRDLQDIKKPLMESLEITLQSLLVMQIFVKNISPNKNKLQSAMTPEIFATEKTLQLVSKGKSFRDAYRLVKNELGGGDKK